MVWTNRATSLKCQVCGHGYTKEKTWSRFYSVCKAWVVGYCGACGRSERIERV